MDDMITALFPPGVRTVEATPDMWSGSLLPAEESCVDGCVPKRRREFTAGRLCARKALSQLGIRHFPLLAGDDRAPRWPKGIAGTISHTETYCAAAVVRVGDVLSIGFDAEDITPLEANLVPMVCTPAERDHVQALPGRDAATWAKLLFSAKESTYKCYYPLAHTLLDFHDVSVNLKPDDGTFRASLIRAEAPAAQGARTFCGRFHFGPTHLFAATTLQRGDI